MARGERGSIHHFLAVFLSWGGFFGGFFWFGLSKKKKKIFKKGGPGAKTYTGGGPFFFFFSKGIIGAKFSKKLFWVQKKNPGPPHQRKKGGKNKNFWETPRGKKFFFSSLC